MEDFDISNLIYIIATLVAILIGVLGKKKKPAGKPVPEKPEPEMSETFVDKFGQDLGGLLNITREDTVIMPENEYTLASDEEPAYADSYEEEEISREQYEGSRINNDEGEYETNLVENRELIDNGAIRATEQIEIIDLDEEMEEGTDYFEIIDEFDAGKAVVYSAILNRPAY